MKKLLLLAIASVLAGCTTLAPGADAVRITHDPAQVASCKAVGSVLSSPPYVMPGDDLKQMRNEATALGGNVILRTGPRVLATRGVAYRCGP